MPESLHVSLFGAPRCAYKGEPVRIDGRNLCAVLLAMVILGERGRRVSRRLLAQELWPFASPAAAAADLRRHLSTLVADLPAEHAWIGRDGEALWWNAEAPLTCDVVEFERGDLERYAGDFMEGYSHEWVLAQRERLRARAVELYVRRAVEHQERDEYAAALASVRRACEIDPMNESVVQLEIELHGERGDVEALRRTFEMFEERVRRELDAAPDAATRELVERFEHGARASIARLPTPLTSFVGNALPLRTVTALAREHRLVTVTGPGGSGKTRLAIEAARSLAAHFRDGAYFVDLSSSSPGAPVLEIVLRALSLPAEVARKGYDGLRSFLSHRRALVVLDNCEHVTEACAELATSMLRDASRVTLLATSREPLGVQCEMLYRLEPMTVSDAVDLFLERAQRVGGIGDRDLVRSVRICEQLDRLPLAIELAAGTLATLTIGDAERGLVDRFALLRSRDPSLPRRHRSLESVIEWSYDLLGERERLALRRAACFAGPFSVEAFRAVCDQNVGMLTTLVEKSLVGREDPISGSYRVPISTAVFARNRLDEADERVARDAHAAYYAALVGVSRTESFWRRESSWLDDVERSFQNVAAAFEWTMFGGGDRALGARIALGAAPYFDRRGHYEAGAEWIDAALATCNGDDVVHAGLLAAGSQSDTRRMRYDEALARARSATAMYERLGLERDLGRALVREGAVLVWMDRREEALSLLQRAAEIAQRTRDPRTEALVHGNLAAIFRHEDVERAREEDRAAFRKAETAGDRGLMSRLLSDLAYNEFLMGRFDDAGALTERALELQRSLGDVPAQAESLVDLGDVAMMQRVLPQARRRYGEALALAQSFGLPKTAGRAIAGFAAVAAESGSGRDAAWLLGASERANRSPLDGYSDVTRVERIRARALEDVDATAFDEAMNAGRVASQEALQAHLATLNAQISRAG